LWTSRESGRISDGPLETSLGIFAEEVNTDSRQMAMVADFVSRMRESEKSPVGETGRFWMEWRQTLIDPMERLLQKIGF